MPSETPAQGREILPPSGLQFIHTKQTKPTLMIRKFFAIAAASLALTAPAMAELTRVPYGVEAKESFSAPAADGSSHSIEVLRMDHEGDFQIWVTTSSRATGQWEFTNEYYWINCSTNQISNDGKWWDINHMNMEGYYYDAACRPWVAN